MNFKSLTICNYKNFHRDNRIDFNPSEKRNLILIGGKNGAGKTTFLESIKLCLFGRQFNGTAMSKAEYTDFIASCKNKKSVKEDDNEYYLQMEIELTEAIPPYTLTVQREWKPNGNGYKEEFSIYRGENPLEIIPQEYWEEYISTLIPPFISNYFFFDGERVKDISTGDKADKILHDSIRDLIGLNLYETLKTDLDKLRSNIARRNIELDSVEEVTRAMDDELTAISEEIKQIDLDVTEREERIVALNELIIDLESDLTRTAGAYAKERKSNEDEALSIKSEVREQEEEIKQICGNILPFIMPAQLKTQLIRQLKKEMKIKELQANKNILEKVNKKVQRRLNKSDVLTEQGKRIQKTINKEVDNIFIELIEELSIDSKEKVFHDLTHAKYNNILSFLDEIESEQKQKLRSNLKKRENRLLKLKKLDDKIGRVPKDKHIKEIITKVTKKKTDVAKLESAIESLITTQISLRDEFDLQRTELVERENQMIVVLEDKKKVELSNTIQQVIDDYSKELVSLKVGELEGYINEMYHKLKNKDDMVKAIVINRDSFSTELYDFEDNLVNKNEISAGEKEIYALSVLWGLSKISNTRLPIIIDSPLSKLDGTHVNNILQQFFPQAAHQVILLSHDREIDKQGYNRIKSKVNHTYTLSKSQEEKFVDGYFFKV